MLLAIFHGNLGDVFTMKTTRKSQALEKTNIACLYRSTASGIFYGIFTGK